MQRPPQQEAADEEARVLQGVQGGLLQRAVVERGDVPHVEQGDPEEQRRSRVGEGSERLLDVGEPARGGAHDHAREAEHDQQRGEIADQDVLCHVGREEVLLAQLVERARAALRPGSRPRRRSTRSATTRGRASRTRGGRRGSATRRCQVAQEGGDDQRLEPPAEDWICDRGIVVSGVPAGNPRPGTLGRCSPRGSNCCSCPLLPPLCRACGAQLAPGQGLCGRCRAELTWLGPGQPPAAGIPAWAPVAYAGPRAIWWPG